MNRTENNREVMEIVLLVLLTFIIVFLLRSSFNRRANNIVIKVSELTSVTDYRVNISGEERILGEEGVPLDIQDRL